MDLNKYKHLFKWLDNAFTELVFANLPRNTKFLGINFVIESHLLERSKMRYLQADIYLGDYGPKASGVIKVSAPSSAAVLTVFYG